MKTITCWGIELEGLLDSGAQTNLVNKSLVPPNEPTYPSNVNLIGPTGFTIALNPRFAISEVDGSPLRFYLVEGLQQDVILGTPFLNRATQYDIMRIDTTGVAKDGGRLRQLSEPEQDALNERISEGLERGWIRPSSATTAANILFVPKKNGKLRMCVDYRELNKVTKRDAYPLPLLWECLQHARQGRIFSVIDISNAFHRIAIDKGSEHLTAFKTNKGMFEYTVMPFGMTNAPSTFQRFIDQVLRLHESYCMVYLDDILIFSPDEEAHQEHLHKILHTLAEENIDINPEKVQGPSASVTYLGMRVSHDYITPLMDYESIQSWPEPSMKRELQQFLGLANWFRNFVPGLSHVLSPMYSLTGVQIWKWDDTHRAAFAETKNKLVNHISIGRFNNRRPLGIYTDASQFGTGAVLMQSGEPIGVTSKSLNKAERNYTTTERELLAVVRAVKTWRAYLESTREQIIVYTDHKSITQELNKVGTNRRLNRWQLAIGQYPLLFEYMPGRDNLADLPSRRPDYEPEPDSATWSTNFTPPLGGASWYEGSGDDTD